MTISLVTDSTSDLPAELASRYNIRVVPSLLAIGEKSYRDGVDMTRAEFYAQLKTFNPLPTTAAPGAGEFEAAFLAAPDGPVISLHTASTLSGLYNSARIGAQSLGERVTVIDTGSLSLGVGWQTLAAAEAIELGAALPQVLEAIASARQRLKVFALLDTLENLRRSGRMSLLRASIASMLQIKPLIELAEGTITAVAQNRAMKKAMADFIGRVKGYGALERLGVMYTDNETLAVEVRDALAGQCPSAPLFIQVAPTIGTHIGPNAVAVALVLAP
jgi:DegV family protein with EDD domain